MDVESLAKQLILQNMTPEQQTAVLDSIRASVLQAKEVQKQRVGENVQVVVQALKKLEADIRSRYDETGKAIEKRVASIKDGKDGRNGVNGKDGKDGRAGQDGATGPRGADGLNGRDGRDGENGVSVTDANIDFDGSLIITLSSGRTINVGEVVAPDLAEQIKVITNGGGTSQVVIDTLASLQTQIDNLIPSQTGNAGKFLTTNGTAVSWASIAAGGLSYQGTWNASTNTPTLTSSAGTTGYYYIVATAGSTNLDGITDWEIGDWLLYNGTVWQKIDQSNLVTSVNGQTGAVSLSTTDIGEGTNLYYTDTRARAAVSAGTGISYDNSTGVITNAAPDQTVALTQGGTTTITGTYPNFTISSADQYAGTVTSVGGTGTVNGISLSGTVTSSGNLTLGGTLDLSSPPAIGGSTPAAGAFTSLTATSGAISANTTSDALRITQTGTGNALLVEDSTNPDSTPFVIDTSGRVLVGTTAAQTMAGATPQVQYHATAGSFTQALVSWNSGATTKGEVRFLKSTSGVVGTQGSVSSGSDLGLLSFYGDDGTAFIEAASILAEVDGTPGTNDMPGRLVFSTTADGASSPTERMRITSAGNVGIGTAAPLTALNVNGTGGELLRLSVTSDAGVIQEPAIGFATGVTNTHPAAKISALEASASNARASLLFYTRDSSSDVAPTERMRIDSSGNVGIGTSAADAKLLVDSGVTFDPLLARTTPAILARGTGTAGAGAYGGAISFSQINSSRPWGAISGVQQGADVDQGGLAFFVHGSTSTNDQTQEVVRIDSSGNVGIGKTPSDKVLELYSASNTAIRIQNSTTGTATSDGLLIEQSGVDAQIVNYEAGALKFFTSGTERARITSSGDFLLNATSFNASADNFRWSVTGIQLGRSAAGDQIAFFTAGSFSGKITSTTTSVTYATSSDYRLKEAIAPMTGALAKVAALKPCTYKWKVDGSDGQGFIAHELAEVEPGCVIGEKDAVDEEGNPQYQGIDTSFLVATLTAAIQELKAIVDAQAVEIAALKAI